MKDVIQIEVGEVLIRDVVENNFLNIYMDCFSKVRDRMIEVIQEGEEVLGYDEFGVSLSNDKNTSQPFGFTGYQFDTITGTHFAQAREYQPMVGRFISEDLVRGFADTPQSLNAYVYCWNQPMDFIDLDGLILRRAWNAVTTAVSTVVDVVVGIDQAVTGFAQTVVGAICAAVGGAAGFVIGGGIGGVIGGVAGIFNGDGFIEGMRDGARTGAGIGAARGALSGLTMGYVGLNNIAQGLTRAGQLEYNYNMANIFNSRISNYRGQVVIRGIPGMGSSGMSLGPIMLLGNDVRNDEGGRRLVRHEHGHLLEYQQLGFLRYLAGIGIPSLINAEFRDQNDPESRHFILNFRYNNQAHEIHAEILAGIYRPNYHRIEAIVMGMLYFEHLNSRGLFSIAGNAWDFTDHNLSAVKEGRL